MTEKEHIDIVFLQQLEDLLKSSLYWLEYGPNRGSVDPRLTRKQFYELISKLEEHQTMISQLHEELERIKKKQDEYFSFIKNDETTKVAEEIDCDHWRMLITTHKQVIRILELQNAEQGHEFHYSKWIELEQRKERVIQLEEKINQNCN
jgi:hypothetical protein